MFFCVELKMFSFLTLCRLVMGLLRSRTLFFMDAPHLPDDNHWATVKNSRSFESSACRRLVPFRRPWPWEWPWNGCGGRLKDRKAEPMSSSIMFSIFVFPLGIFSSSHNCMWNKEDCLPRFKLMKSSTDCYFHF